MNAMYIIQNNQVLEVCDYMYKQYEGSPRIFISSSEKKFENYIDENDIPRQKLLNPWTVWDANTKLASIRLQRDYLLIKSDWIVSKYAETLTEVPQNWRDYRQDLRDFPSTVNVNLPIEQIVWPVSP